MKDFRPLRLRTFTFLIALLLLVQSFTSFVLGARPVRLVVDSREVTSNPRPVIIEGRTLVPIRFVLEQFGADFDWWPKQGKVERVTITKGDIEVNLIIDSQLVSYEKDGRHHIVTDVAPRIIEDRTFVPVRLISNIFGLSIDWDNASRTVLIDSSKEGEVDPFYPLKITSLEDGETIQGKTSLKVDLGQDKIKDGKFIRFMLLNPQTAEGRIISQGSDLTKEYTYLPKLDDQGERAIVAAIYDGEGRILSADAVAVNVKLRPRVSLNGIKDGDVVKDRLTVKPDVNFVAKYVEYEIINIDKDKVIIPNEKDPYGSYSWSPSVRDNGNYSIKVTAYDEEGNSYVSKSYEFKVDISHSLSLTGLSKGMIVDKPVTLNVSRNFDVDYTCYVLRDPITGEEEILKSLPYGSYRWFPGPEYKGKKEVFVRVKYAGSKIMESSPVEINLPGKANILLEGIGPNEVVTADKTIKVNSNVDLDHVNYVITDGNNKKKVITLKPEEELVFSPTSFGVGSFKIYAEGLYDGNKSIRTEEVSFKVYLGEIYGKTKVIEKDKFLGVASKLARESFLRTGLSAALQTSQSILETGWGQYVGVDKYTGRISYNLFGIKGEGPAGSVLFTTWEVYNGIRYTVDDRFRAYNSIDESWKDYNAFLLERERYAPVREVMYDSTQAAWALRRAGYATDPEYPLKLIRIIEERNLNELDKVRI